MSEEDFSIISDYNKKKEQKRDCIYRFFKTKKEKKNF